jgi:hypothetical protein
VPASLPRVFTNLTLVRKTYAKAVANDSRARNEWGKAYSFSAHSSGKAVFRSAPNITKKTAENRIIRKLLVLEILSSELS